MKLLIPPELLFSFSLLPWARYVLNPSTLQVPLYRVDIAMKKDDGSNEPIDSEEPEGRISVNHGYEDCITYSALSAVCAKAHCILG